MDELTVKLGADGRELPPELKKASDEFKKYGKKVESVLSESELAYVRTKTASRSFTTSIRESLGSASQAVGVDISSVTGNLENLGGGLRKISQTSKDTGQSISKTLVSSLTGSGGLLLGVSAVTTALTLLAQNPQLVSAAIDYLAGVVKSATGTQKKYNDELAETSAKAQVEIINLRNLITIAKNEALSREARTEAVKKLKKEYPEQLKFLSLENIESKKTATAIDLLSNSLIRKAKIQAAEKILGEVFVKQLKAQNQSVTEQASALAKLTGALMTAAGFKNTIVLTEGFKEQQKTIKETNKDISTYSELLKKLNSEEAVSGTLFDDSKVKTKKTKTLASVMKDLKNDLSALSLDKSLTFGTIDAKRIDAYQKALNALVDLGIKPTSKEIKDVQANIEKFNQTTLLQNEFKDFQKRNKEALSKSKSDLNDFVSEIDKLRQNAATLFEQNVNKSPFEVQQNNLKSFIETQKFLLQQAAIDFDTYKKRVGEALMQQDLLTQIQTFTTNIASAFSGLFTGILTEGKISFKSLGNAILQEFARILGSAIVKKLASLFLNFATGGGAGIFGTVFKFLGGSAGKIPGFANGVTNFSGGLAKVHKGELLTNLAPGTSVIPANMVGGGGGAVQVLIANSYQRADMIVTSYDRGERQLGRII